MWKRICKLLEICFSLPKCNFRSLGMSGKPLYKTTLLKSSSSTFCKVRKEKEGFIQSRWPQGKQKMDVLSPVHKSSTNQPALCQVHLSWFLSWIRYLSNKMDAISCAWKN
ncbi:uncharacterized protein [Rhodnius prolixus]|uniref:uncharacterized protein n=1 Tax=Rhodnius prolixus TaxID=13249 RepID=UPI003D1887C4